MKKIIYLSLLLFAGSVNAGLILDIVGGVAASDSRDFTLGWSFTVNSSIAIDGLGLWDEGSDGFSYASGYEVALWENTGGSLLTSVIVDNASTATLSSNTFGQWMFSDISELVLGIGDYTVGYLRPGGSDQWRFATTAVNTISEITFGDRLELVGSSLALPTTVTGSSDGHFGPNIRVASEASVPEPASIALLGLGLAGIGFSRTKKVA